MKQFIAFLLFSGVLLLFSCKKEGPPGQQGIPGERGTTGAPGTTGTANVIYSGWLSLTFVPVVTNWRAEIAVPKLTKEIMDKGEIIVYMTNGTFVYKLNYYFGNFSLVQNAAIGKIEINASANASNFKFRYMLIPGGISARTSSDISKMDYLQLCKYYNLEP